MSSVAIVDPEQLRARAPRRRLTVADYHRMGDAGILHEDDRIELIDGELFQMASIGTPHMAVVIRLTSRFGALAADRFLVSTQNSIEIPHLSEPQPDIVLLRPPLALYARTNEYGCDLPGSGRRAFATASQPDTRRDDRDLRMRPVHVGHHSRDCGEHCQSEYDRVCNLDY